MRLWRQIGQQRWAKVTIGIVAAEYLRFVGRTTRFTLEPADRLTDRYGRKLFVVTRAGTSLGRRLEAEGLAEPWRGWRRDWC